VSVIQRVHHSIGRASLDEVSRATEKKLSINLDSKWQRELNFNASRDYYLKVSLVFGACQFIKFGHFWIQNGFMGYSSRNNPLKKWSFYEVLRSKINGLNHSELSLTVEI
jgi:hypothetical protein